MDTEVLRERSGDDAVFAALVQQHSGRVFRLAYRLTGNRADAEDITQEVFVRALGSQVRNRGGVEGWFHRVTTNLFIDTTRRRRRSTVTSLDHLAGARDVPDPGADPGVQALVGELEADVEAALATLPPALREAVVLSDVHQLSCAEIAEVVGTKNATVRTRLHRGRAMLRERLAHRAPAPGRARHGGPADDAHSVVRVTRVGAPSVGSLLPLGP